MNLDLNLFTADWQPSRDAIAARRLIGSDGAECIQLRVDLGLLQMAAHGRPDGERVCGQPTALAHARHELRLGRPISSEIEAEIERELHQYNYRRLAYNGLSDDALAANDMTSAIDLMQRTIVDTDHCLDLLRLLAEHCEESAAGNAAQVPVLVFNRARLHSRALALEDRFEEAIDAAREGIDALTEALSLAGFDEDQMSRDAGLAYLRQTIERMRKQNNIGQTLVERLADAVAREDFAAAARLRDALQARRARATRAD